jgi:hypothetical protein
MQVSCTSIASTLKSQHQPDQIGDPNQTLLSRIYLNTSILRCRKHQIVHTKSIYFVSCRKIPRRRVSKAPESTR